MSVELEMPEDECEIFWCDNASVKAVNCGCFPESHGWNYRLCGECTEWMQGRITCPFHGDVD